MRRTRSFEIFFVIILTVFLLNGQTFKSGYPSVLAADAPDHSPADTTGHSETQEEHDGHASGGLPQFNPDYFPTQLFWLFICFSILYCLVAYIGLPRVVDIIEKREDRIAYDLDRVQELKNEIEAITKQTQHNLEQAQEQAQHILHDMAEQINKQRLEYTQNLDNKIQKRLLQAEQRIQEEKQIVLNQTEDIATTLTITLIQKLSNESLDSYQVREMIKKTQQERGDSGNI